MVPFANIMQTKGLGQSDKAHLLNPAHSNKGKVKLLEHEEKSHSSNDEAMKWHFDNFDRSYP